MTKSRGWEVVREAVRQQVGPSAYDAWFRTLEGSVEGDTLVICCPDRFSRDWISGRYGRIIESSAPEVRQVDYRVAPTPALPTSERSRSTRAGFQKPNAEARPRLGFEDFVMGPGNALALKAARAIASGQAGRCSPLVLAGGSGVGKTHLCRAIQTSLPNQVLYRSSEDFTAEVTHAMRTGQMQSIRQRYRRSTNVLILEDVQFLEGKRATQIEFFHTLDHLLSHGRTVILSCDRPPRR